MAVFEDGLAGLTTTIGTGSYLIGGNVAGYREISQLADGLARVFVVRTATDFEIGLYTKSGGSTPTLARTAIYRTRSGGTTAVNWPVGEKTIHSTVSANVLSAVSESEARTGDLLMRGTKVCWDIDDNSTTYSDTDGQVVTTLNGVEILRLYNPGSPRCLLTYVDAGSAAGPIYQMHRASSSPAAGDTLGSIWWTGNDSAGNVDTYGVIEARIDDPTSGSEGSGWNFRLKRNGADHFAMILNEAYLKVFPNIQDAGVGVLVGKTGQGANIVGCELLSSGTGAFTTNLIPPLVVNRKGNDGTIIELMRDGVAIGGIAVTSGVVSYGTFISHHPSALAGGNVTELETGTVMVTIDEQWEPHGRNHLPRVAVSTQRGDRRVYGCYAAVSEGNMIIHAGGAWQALVKGPVVGGDLLWTSDTAGVAEKQPDDLKRAATLGKVTMSDNRDQVRLVPCILEAG